MTELITPFNDIVKELQEMQSNIEVEISDNIDEAVERGNVLAVYIARSGKLLADAKYHKEKKLRSDVVSEIKQIVKLPPSVAVKFVDTLVEKENYLMTWADRLNRTCTHQLEWCRTLVSKAKAEMSAFKQ
jgi:hypothetical protein